MPGERGYWPTLIVFAIVVGGIAGAACAWLLP